MGFYFDCKYWGLRWRVERYRLCEKTFEAVEIAIGPLYIEWDEWQ